MSVDCFLDTNVIVYAAAGRGVESAKRERALDLIETREFGLSAQVLQEFYVTVVHKIQIPLAPSAALEWSTLRTGRGPESFPAVTSNEPT